MVGVQFATAIRVREKILEKYMTFNIIRYYSSIF